MTTQQLHDLINEKIYENHVGAITATDMNTILNEMVSEEEQIRQTYLPLIGGTITGPLSLRNTLTLPRNIVAIDTDGADELLEIDYTSSPYKVKFGIGYDQLVLRADEIIKYDTNWNEYKLLDTGHQIFTNIEKLQVRENIGAVSSSDVDNKINLLDSSITKETSTPVNSSAAGSYKKIAVVNGFSLKQTDGKLVDLNALGNPSIVSTVEVDVAGSAQKALSDAKSYSDSLITGLGSVMTFKGVKNTEAEVKSLTNQKRGWVWLVRADNSEWVATDDIGSSPNPSKWEKFGDGNISNQANMSALEGEDGYIANKVGGYKIEASSDDIRINYSGSFDDMDDPLMPSWDQLLSAGMPEHVKVLLKNDVRKLRTYFFDSQDTFLGNGWISYNFEFNSSGPIITGPNNLSFSYFELDATSDSEDPETGIPYAYIHYSPGIIRGEAEITANRVTSISSASTNFEYPSAKAVYDALQGTKPMSFVTLNQGSGDYLYFTGSGTALLSISDGENDPSVLFVYYGIGGDYTNVYIYAADSNYKDYDVDFIIDNDISKSYILLSGSSGVVTFGFMKLSGDIGYDVNGQPDMIDVETIPIIELERTSNKVTSLSASSTDIEYPSAKCVYDAIDDAQNVFIVTYGTTIYSNIQTAYTDGKVVVMPYRVSSYDRIFYLIENNIDAGFIYFYSYNPETKEIWYCSVNDSNTWSSFSSFVPEDHSKLVTSWQSTTDNTHYPSEKLVKDNLDGKQDTLVSGNNIKTINAETILGSGDITVYYPGTYIGTGTGWGAGTTSGYLRSNYFQGNTPSKVGDLVYSTSTGCLHKITALHYDSGQSCYYADSVYYVTTFERTSRLVTSISSASTDAQYPSAKCVYDLVGNIETLLASI